MILLDEIREYFASTINGARKIKCLPENYSAFVIRSDEGYGIAIPNKYNVMISEKFANSRIYSSVLSIDGVEENYLILTSTLDSLRYEFATICAQFAEVGQEGNNRENILANPLNWWRQWKSLMGNTISNKEVYSIIAELLALEYLLENNSNVEWTSIISGSHDIETQNRSYEVKSTIKRYGATVTISSQHQLRSKKELYILFCRLEKSRMGVSINDMKVKLALLGYDSEIFEMQMLSLGFERGTSIRDERYKVLEKRKYAVDEHFPRITKESFKEDKIPGSIIKITYEVDLEGFDYTSW